MSARRTNILVLRGGAIGDFVLTTPVLQALRDHRPGSRLTLCCHPRMAALALAGRLADETKSIDGLEVARLFARGAEQDPEWAAFVKSCAEVVSLLHDPDGLVRENLLRAGAGRVVCGSPLVGSGHAADWLVRPLAKIGIGIKSPAVPRLRLHEDRVGEGRRRLVALTDDETRNVIAIHPGSGGVKKNWPVTRFAILAGRLFDECGVLPLFIFGEADAGARESLAAEQPEIPVLAGCDLLEVASVIAACRGYVGNDSGITHLAAALGTPTVALFGPTDPAVWGPRGSNVRIIRAQGEAGGDMANIDVEAVLEGVLRLIC